MDQNPRAQRMRFRSKELITMALLLVIGEFVGIGGSYVTLSSNAELSKILAQAAITLFFGALLGGVVTALIADFDRYRLQRAAQLDFSSNVLTDLKSVYDGVDRGRTLIRAHQSAKRYGEEMRHLIEARIKLLNVVRALKFDERGVSLMTIGTKVAMMESYLKTPIDEYEQEYKKISLLQSLYEFRVKQVLEKSVSAPDAAVFPPANKPWEAIECLKSVADFMVPVEKCGAMSARTTSEYCRLFLAPLDEASEQLREILRKELE